MPAPYQAMDEPITVSGASKNSDLGNFVLRVVVGLMVIHHGLQKIQNPQGFADGMVATWFPWLPAPLFWTYVAIFMEAAGPACLILGVAVRTASFGLFATMAFANSFHFLATGFEGFPTGVPAGGAYAFEPSLLCMGIFFYLMCAGSGRYALMPGKW